MSINLQIRLKFYISDCPDTFAVRRLFVFLKENLNFDYLQDEFIQRNIISQRELADYILTVHEYLRSEQLLKLIIKRKRCQEFVVCMQDFPEFEHINQIIRKFKNKRGLKGNAMNKISFILLPFFHSLYPWFYFYSLGFLSFNYFLFFYFV